MQADRRSLNQYVRLMIEGGVAGRATKQPTTKPKP
jgi:hypothetical protein